MEALLTGSIAIGVELVLKFHADWPVLSILLLGCLLAIAALIIDEAGGRVKSDDEEVEQTSSFTDLLLPSACLTKKHSKHTLARVASRRTKKTIIDMVEISRGHKVYKYSTLNWTFDADAVPATHSPLLCFVNSLSGGQQGEHVKRQLRSLLHPFQVVDVSEMDPIISLRLFAQLAQYRVLVCGGDGTVGWVLDAIQTAHRESGNRESGKSLPPVGILPIGTGNDLSISLGWGHTFRGGGVARALEGVRRARRVQLDRWHAHIQPTTSTTTQKRPESLPARRNRPNHSRRPKSLPSSSFLIPEAGGGGGEGSKGKGKEGKGDTEGDTGAAVAAAGGVSRTFQNYLGVGVDAMVVYRFHAMRASAPELFFHRWMNKIFYGWMGFSQIFSRSFEDFGTQVTLRVDGRLVPLPPGTQGVVVLNIRSYGGGSKLWEGDSSEGGDCDSGSGGSGDIESESNGDCGDSGGSGGGSDNEYFDNFISPTKDEPLDLREVGSHCPSPNNSFRPVSISDGLFEVVAVRGSFELARVKMGLADVQRIAQGSSLSLTISHPTTMQADGEPWVQQPCVVTVGAGEQACMLEAELPAKFFDHLDDLGSEGGSEEGAVGAGAGRAGGDVPQT